MIQIEFGIPAFILARLPFIALKVAAPLREVSCEKLKENPQKNLGSIAKGSSVLRKDHNCSKN
jgi:hypothetical protein